MIPGGFCFAEAALPRSPLCHVVHKRSNGSEAIIYPFVSDAGIGTRLARELNLEIREKLGSKTADELRRLARQLMAEDTPTLSEG